MASLTFARARRRWQQARSRRGLIADRPVAIGESWRFEDWPSRAARPALAAPLATAAAGAAPYAVSCIMPAYNERASIGRAVRRMRRAAEQLTSDFEIIVVDDGSTDGTRQLLEEMANERLRIVGLATNCGYGRALRAGFEAAVHPLVFFTDSDNQFDPQDLGRLLPLVADAEIVVGYRVGRRDGAVRALLSRGYNMLVRGLLGLTVRDVNCAFKLVRRDALSNLGLTSDGYAINAEMLARAQRDGLRVREAAVLHRPRMTGRSKVGLREIPRSLLQVLELSYTLRGRNGRRHLPEEP